MSVVSVAQSLSLTLPLVSHSNDESIFTHGTVQCFEIQCTQNDMCDICYFYKFSPHLIMTII